MTLRSRRTFRRIWALTGMAVAASLLTALSLAGPLTDKGTQPPLQFPIQSPLACAACHAGYDQANNVEQVDTWSGSMMAQASRDPIFWAALDVANNDLPGVGDFCLRCHVPTGWLAGRSEPPDGSVDGCELEGNIDERNNDFEGVSCHLCHRMQVNSSPPMGEDPVYLENGQFWIADRQCTGFGEPCRGGPYDYPMAPSAPHAWDSSQYHIDADNCGNCHNVTHPAANLIENGVDTGALFPIERTFMEWQASDFAPGGPDFQTCQNCHMPDATADPVYASSFQFYNRTGDMPIHQFAGGNSWVPEVLRNEYPNLNLNNSFVATRDWTIGMLQNQSATIENLAPASIDDGQTIDLEVKVTNLTGHKLPTGYPEGRRMWVNVEARDAMNNLVWESGAYDASTGLLTHDAQVKIYSGEAGIWNHNGTSECDIVDGVGDPMFHFVLNNCWKIDNRIPPKGFTGGTDQEIKPVNYSYPEVSPGVLQHWDTTDYSIPVPPGTPGPVTVTATLQYQTMSKEYVDFLLDQSDTHGFPDDCIERSAGTPAQTRAEILHDMWNTYGKAAPVSMVAAMSAVTINPAGGTPGEASAPAAPMLVTGHDTLLGDIDVTYDPACLASDHTVYYGDLANVSTMAFTGQVCGLGDTGSATFNPGPGNLFWLVVANDGSVEGSYGKDSTGAERPEDAALGTCNITQDLSGRCD